MRLRRLDLRNFRGIATGRVDFRGHTLLVGGNNAGKSTICEAIELVLGPERLSRRPVVDEHDFHGGRYLGDDGAPTEIRIDAVLIGLDEEVELRFKSHLRRWSETAGGFVDEAGLGPEGADAADACWALPVCFIGRYDKTEDDFVGGTFFVHPQVDPKDLEPEEAGRLGAGLKSFHRDNKRLCGFVFLRAHRTGSRALSLQRGSLLDTILRLSGDGMSEMWLSSLDSLRTLSPGIGDIPQLKHIRSELEARMARFVPLAPAGGASAFFASDLTREDLREVVRLFVATQPTEFLAPFDRLGTGSLNLLVFALLTFIADLKSTSSVIFAMEEPEIALSPHTQRRISSFILRSMGQAIVTSHSPYVIEQFDPDNIVILRRGAHHDVVGSPIDFIGTKKKTFRSERRQLAEAILAEAVLVVEGSTEVGVFAEASSLLEAAFGSKDYPHLDMAGVSILNAGADSNVPKFGPLLKAMSKRCFAFFDKLNKPFSAEAQVQLASFDFFRESPFKGIEHLLASETPADKLKSFLVEVQERIDYPTACGVLSDTMSEADLRALSNRVLAARKGDAQGYAANLVASLDVNTLPKTLRDMLDAIHLAMKSPPHPSDLPAAPEPKG